MSSSKLKFGPETYTTGEIIIRQGDIPDKFYIITSGYVDIILRRSDGQEMVLDRLGPGDFFGEVGVVKASLRTATVRATSPVELMAMDVDTFRAWLDSSMLSRDEIDEVVAERIERVGGNLQPVGEEALDEAGDKTDPLAATVQAELQKREVVADWGPGVRLFSPGDTIIRQGDIADTFYIIVEGDVEVVQTDDDGAENHIAKLTSGNYFGEMGLLERRERMATVRAVTEVRTVAFDRNTFSTWMSQSPISQDEILQTFQQRHLDNENRGLADQDGD